MGLLPFAILASHLDLGDYRIEREMERIRMTRLTGRLDGERWGEGEVGAELETAI